MKASARKNMPTKQVKQREGDRPNVRQKQIPRNRDDEDTTASESDSIEAPNPVLEAEGDLLIGEQAIGSLQLPKPDSKPEPKPIPNRHKRKPYRGVPKNHPFDASLVLNANPPYALGETYIDRIHLHQMGKKDETGAYVILEEIKLFD